MADIVGLLTTAASGLGGGLLRLAPEVLKLLDRKNERKHELALGEQQMKLLATQSHTRIDEANAKGDNDRSLEALSALRDAIKSQGQLTGNKFIDGMSMLVRPVWTYYVLLVWGTVKTVDVWQSLVNDMPWLEIRGLVWGPEDASMVAALMTFWFLDRVIKKG
jgi:hypothetical protein